MDSVKISVVMCTYNGEAYLRPQLDSILLQTSPPDEIIIQDDSSTDGTWSILREYAQHHKQIKLFRNSVRLGLNQNFINAFQKATSAYIAISDQDDYWRKDKLLQCREALNQYPYTLVYANSSVSDNNLQHLCLMDIPNLNILEIMWMGLAPGHSMVFKKEAIDAVKNLEEIDFIYDWLINVVALNTGEVYKIQQPLVNWRRHGDTTTSLDFIPPAVPYKNPIGVINYCLKRAWRASATKNFKWQFENLYLIFKNFNSKIAVDITTFLKYYRKETLWGFFMASILHYKLRNDLRGMERIKALYTPFYRYYYYQRDGYGLRGR